MAPQAETTAIAVRNTDVDLLQPLKFQPLTSASRYYGNPNYHAHVESMKCLGRKGLVNLLLEKGSCVITQGNGALDMAVARMEWSSVIEKLLALGAKADDKNSHGDTAVHLAFVDVDMDGFVERLLTDYLSESKVNVKNNDGLSFLHIACSRANLEHVRQLVDFGADINCQVDLRSRSPYAGYSPLHFAVFFGRYHIVKFLLRNGASIYAQDYSASTPVHLALNNANWRMIDLLFAHDRRSENCINDFGMTHFMAACAGSFPYIAEKFLLDQPLAFQRVNTRVQDVDEHPYAGYSPIDFARKFGNLATVDLLLKKYGVSRDISKINDMRNNRKWPN